MPAIHRAPDTLLSAEELPGLGDLNAISFRANLLTTGNPVVSPPNFGFTSTHQPVQGWRLAPDLNAAAGPAPRDVQIPVYILTPGPVQSKYARVPPVLMRATQGNKEQSEAIGPVAYFPGGTASLSSVGK